MEISKKEILTCIYEAVDEINEQKTATRPIPRDPHAALFGRNGALDSLGLVNLVVAVEQRVEERFGVAVSLADEKALAQKNSPFASIESLADYVAGLLREQPHA